MRNLCKVEFKVLFKLKLLYLELVVVFLLAIVMGIVSLLNNESSLSSLFNGMFIISMIYPALGGTFLLTDFKQKTINNKIIAGHSRFNIYTTKLIALTVLYVISIIAYYIPATIISFIGPSFDINWTILFKNFFIVGLAGMFNICMTLFFNMILHAEVGLAVGTIMTEVFSMGSMFLLEFLSLSDKYKTLSEWVAAFPPAKIMMLTMEAAPEHIEYTVVMTLIACTMFFFGGFAIFRTQDLP